MEGKRRVQVAFGIQAIVTISLRSPAPSGLCHPPAQLTLPFPLSPSWSQSQPGWL